MKRYFFNIIFADGEEEAKTTDSISKVAAITMAVNQLLADRQEQITTIEVYAEKELKV
jgi:hypothetical protein